MTTPSPTTDRLLHAGTADRDLDWWRDAVVYQIYPRSFADGDGDGMGDLPGITARLGHVRELGADAVWLSPFYASPQKDAGYDVADYREVDPLFGSLADAEALLERARSLGLKVIVDLVPNHTSDQHDWFRAALAAGPGSPERARYIFRPGRGEDGEQPPNDWGSVFGSVAWTRVKDRADAPGSAWADDDEWYLHLFDASQPDLDWDNPEVRDEFDSILRFWLDRGVDGFRVDVAHGLVKDPDLPDWQWHWDMVSGSVVDRTQIPPPPMWDQDGVHEVYRRWRRILDDYSPARILVAEAWVDDDARLANYLRPDEMHQAFNFHVLVTPYSAAEYRSAIAESLAAVDAVGAPATWVQSNHDVVRHASRLGLPETGKGPNGIRATDVQPDAALGLRRARAVTQLMLALPGSAYLYQGEELGLPEHTALPDDVRQDPAFFRTGGKEAGRDGCRVPMPWAAGDPAYGFSTTGESWLPQPPSYGEVAVDTQVGVVGSTLELYRTALRLRRELGLGTASLALAQEIDGSVGAGGADGSGAERGVDGGEHVLGLVSGAGTPQEMLVLMVTGGAPVPLPAGWRVVLSSDTGTDRVGQGVGADGAEDGSAVLVHPDTTVWAVRAH